MKRALIWVGATLVGSLVHVGAAVSQDDPSGLKLTFGIASTLRASDNVDLDPVSPGRTVRSDTRLSFGLESETRSQNLSVTADALLRAEDAPVTGSTTGLEQPGIAFSYAREGANARLSFTGSFDRVDIDSFDLIGEEDIDDDDLVVDTGTRDDYRLGATLETGLQSPLGFLLGLEGRTTRYEGTTDPSLTNSTTNSARAEARLRVSPVTEGRIALSAERYEVEDAAMTTRDARALSFGVTYELSKINVIEASLGVREIDDSVAGVRRGVEGALSFGLMLPRGRLSLSTESEQTSAGRRSTVELERQFEFPTGSLTFRLGAADFSGTDPAAIGTLAYSQDLPSGSITASLSRTVSANSDAEIQRTTRAALGYDFTINALSSVVFNLDYAEANDGGSGGVKESARGNFRATYRRSLTEDWSLAAGYERRYLDETGAGSAWDDAVFVTIDRVFTISPF